MAIKLIKACKLLNIGMSTAVEFCNGIGKPIPSDPNARIGNDVYIQLAKEYSAEVYLKLIASNVGNSGQVLSADNIPADNSNQPQYRLKRICREFNLKVDELRKILENHNITKSLDDNCVFSREEYDFIREIYLNSPKGLRMIRRENEEIDKETLKEIWKAHTDVQEQILKLRSTPIKIDPNSIEVVGDRMYVQAVLDNGFDEVVNYISNTLDTHITEQDFSNRYIFVKEETLSELSDIQRNRILELTAANTIGFSFRPMVDGIIKSRTTNTRKFYELLDALHIRPMLDKQGKMLLTTNELSKLSKKIANNHEVDVPTQASAIINISVSPIFALSKEFPNIEFGAEFEREKCYSTNELGEKVNISRFTHAIAVRGGYFTEEIAQMLFDVYGMKLYRVDFCFNLTPAAIASYKNRGSEPIAGLKIKNDSFVISRNLIYHKDPLDDEILEEDNLIVDETESDSRVVELNYDRLQRNILKFSMQLSAWKTTMDQFFGKSGYTLEVKYLYRYNNKKRDWLTEELKTEFENKLRSYLPSNVSVGKSLKNIGVDFDWTEDDLFNITRRLNKSCPFVRFDIFDNHKCKVDIKVSDLYLKETVELMQERFEGLVFKEGDSRNEIYFYKECDSLEQYITVRNLLLKETRGLSNDKVDVEINSDLANHVKLRFENDEESRNEEQLESIKELRGAEFLIGDKRLGILIKVHDYPTLVFDISSDDVEKTKEILNNFEGDYLHPNLIGDQEKVARLKESLHKITSGKGVQNPSLNDFIFDATTLRPDASFNELFRLELQEIEKHLLNESVNASQKKAIAKSLVSQDLSLIQGPPGTGKSTAIAEIIWQHIRKNKDTKILLTSETNLAVDNAIAKMLNKQHTLVKPIRIGTSERLESEGRQFSLEVLQKWAGINVLNRIPGTEDDDFEFDSLYDDEDDLLPEIDSDTSILSDDDEDVVLQDSSNKKDSELNVLDKWLRNIVNRADQSRMPEGLIEKWKTFADDPDEIVRKTVYNAYLKHCNVIGATCSSIGKENIMLSRLLSDKYGTESKALCSFYKVYQQIYGESRVNPMSGRLSWSQPDIRFNVVIQDESSKATPAELSLPLIYGYKNIVIGDHRQLPPMLSKESFEQSFDFLLSRAQDAEEKQRLLDLKRFVTRNFKKLEVSQFERLFRDIPSEMKGVFNTQYRMHPAINEVIKQFYSHDGGLSCGLSDADNPDIHNPSSRYHGINIPGLISEDDHVLWIDTKTPEMLDGTSRINYGEVDVIRKILHSFADSDSYKDYLNEWENKEDKQIGLISFYGKQLRLLRDVSHEVPQLPIRISTVDRFQGMERNIVIVSLVRSNCISYNKDDNPNYAKYPDFGYNHQDSLGFADSPNRLNVALSRAKRLLIIVGNSDHFRRHPIYNNVYHTIANETGGRIINAEEL